MGRSRAFIIVAVIALSALTTGFGKPAASEDPTTPQGIVLTGMTRARPLSQTWEPRLGPIPCPDGSTVDFGQFCPIPTIQCADGTSVFIGQFCPVFKPALTTEQAPPAPPQQQAPPPPPQQQAPPPPPSPSDLQKCRELGTC